MPIRKVSLKRVGDEKPLYVFHMNEVLGLAWVLPSFTVADRDWLHGETHETRFNDPIHIPTGEALIFEVE